MNYFDKIIYYNHWFMLHAEDWCSRHSHIIDAITAVGTIGATAFAAIGTVLALWNGKPHLKASVGVRILTGNGVNIEIISLTLSNPGPLPVTFQSLSWIVPRKKLRMLAMPLDGRPGEAFKYGLIPQGYPKSILPNDSCYVTLETVARFRIVLFETSQRENFSPKIWPFIKAVVYTSGGTQFNVKIEANLKKRLSGITAETSAV